jgi:SAM-dependent methyltransferase
MSPSLKDYLTSFNQLLKGERTRQESRIASKRHKDISKYLDLNSSLKILDLGNGRLRPQYYLLDASGHHVVGIDLVNGSYIRWDDRAYLLARWMFTRYIPNHSSLSSPPKLVCGDVAYLPFVDDYFDLITSVAAFEHFLDVPMVVSELQRVLRPGGIAWIGIHLFTSPSGGHNLSFTEIPLRTIPPGIQPWDHLRQKKLSVNVPLNRWRLHQYLQTFSDHFYLLNHYCAGREGEQWLTSEIESELSDFSRDELTCMGYIIVARKPG